MRRNGRSESRMPHRRSGFGLVLSISGLVVAAFVLPRPAAAASQSTVPRKIFHIGWDSQQVISPLERQRQAEILAADPNHWPLYCAPNELISNLPRIQATPLEGVTVYIQDPDPQVIEWPFWEIAKKSVPHKIFSQRSYTYGELSYALEPLAQLQGTNASDNFLPIVTGLLQGGDRTTFSWFNDARWAPILNNFKVYAMIARDAHMKLFVDPEPYQGDPGITFGPFESKYQPDYRQHTLTAFKTQARLRGAQVMHAIQEGAPGIDIVFAMAHSTLIAYSKWGPANIDLLPAFLDGMLDEDARTPVPSMIIDGYEPAYWARTVTDFTNARKNFRDNVIKKHLTAVPTLYKQYMRLSFGNWTDKYDPSYNTPKQFEDALVNGLNESDRYVWVYSERVNTFFWSCEGVNPTISPTFLQSMVNAKARHRVFVGP